MVVGSPTPSQPTSPKGLRAGEVGRTEREKDEEGGRVELGGRVMSLPLLNYTCKSIFKELITVNTD